MVPGLSIHILIPTGHAEMAISRQRGAPDTPGTTPLVTPASTPGHSPEKEELPPFPIEDSIVSDTQVFV